MVTVPVENNTSPSTSPNKAACTLFPKPSMSKLHTYTHTNNTTEINRGTHIYEFLSEKKKKNWIICHHHHLQICNLLIMFLYMADQDSFKLMWQCISVWVMLQYYHSTSESKPGLELECRNWVENGHPSSSDPCNGLWSVPLHFTANFVRWDERCKYVCGFMREPRFMTAVWGPRRSLNTSAPIHHVINPSN